MNVQNRVNIVLFQLPPLVVREGILVSQVVPSMLMYVNIYSTDPDTDQKDLFNFANVYVMPRLKRIKGMGIPRNLGNRIYAMRVWLDPDRMRAYDVSSQDVMAAVANQSVIGSPGRLGEATGKTSQSKEYVLTYIGRFNKPQQYEDIILKANPSGEILHLKDVAEVELGPQFFDIYSDIDGHPAASIVLKQAAGSNAAEVIEAIKTELAKIKKQSFPPRMDYEFAYDVSKFLDASIEKVLHTLLEAFILVSLVVFMFLGDLRSTLIPTLTVPVSLIGTFFVLQLLGLSINLITLFAMVLAIGVVVDDAIVVVEAVHAKMAQKHLSPYMATTEVMHEISGAIIAITLVMTSVFVPVTFIPGAAGTFYRAFGITMATAIILSGLVALTLTPVLCAMILKPHHPIDAEPQAIADTDESSAKNHAAAWPSCSLRWEACWPSPESRMWRTSCGDPSASGSSCYRCCGALLIVPSRKPRTHIPPSCGESRPQAANDRRDRVLCLWNPDRRYGAGVRFHPGRGSGHHLCRPANPARLHARVHEHQIARARKNRQADPRGRIRYIAGRL